MTHDPLSELLRRLQGVGRTRLLIGGIALFFMIASAVFAILWARSQGAM